MSIKSKPYYSPALRMKAGELLGLQCLAVDIADCIIPRLIVPPLTERDESIQTELFLSDHTPDISAAISSNWLQRDVIVETTHLDNDFGLDRKKFWLPQMFARARAANVWAIPAIQSFDLVDHNIDPFLLSIDHHSRLKICIIISSGELERSDICNDVINFMKKVRVVPEECMVILDFHDSDISNSTLVAPIISGALERIQSFAPWQLVVFQGTSYPETNPAEPNTSVLVPRHEWMAWKDAVKFDPSTTDHMIFGDYAADCAKLKFGKSAARAIPHYRYTNTTSWLVQRGGDSGTIKNNMAQVCEKIVESNHFSGRDFSSADNFIYLNAKGLDGPGNAMNWRAINTTHHITRVVTDVGAIKGTIFSRRPSEPLRDQLVLL